MKRTTNEYVTVTRNGDKFTYKHKIDDEPTTSSMSRVIQAAQLMTEKQDRTQYAMIFLREALEMQADSGTIFDECQIRGLAAVCDCIQHATLYDFEEYKVELAILEKLDAGEVLQSQ